MAESRGPLRPVGRATRGTTHPNRLRRVDTWLVSRHGRLLRGAADPLVVDLGFGAHPVTVVELASRLRRVRADIEVVGVEIDPDRVRTAQREAGPIDRVSFVHGGFDLAPLGPRRATVIRAFNVLRQYDAAEVAPTWALLRRRLAPGGLLLDGTCDEIGRLASWVVLDEAGPRCLVMAWRLAGLGHPGEVAARLPKILIERNVAPYRIHRFLTDLDAAWRQAAPLSAWGARQRFAAAVAALGVAGWPVRAPRNGRDGVIEVDWAAIAPSD